MLSSKTSISNAIGIWSKLYNLKFLNDNKIRFNTELTHGEDLIFNLSCYLKSDTIVAISDYVYTYVKENQDSVTTKFSPGLHKKHFKIINVLNEGFKESVVNRYKQNYCDFLLYLLGMCIRKEILHKANTATFAQKICLFKEIISNEYYIECFKSVDKKKLGKGRRLLVDIYQYKMY